MKMTVDFSEHFWGEKNAGYDVLYHNMKYGQIASKELADFIRERSVIEEAQSKFHLKLAKQASNGCAHGTFAPLWKLLKASSERLSSSHQQMVQRFQELIKDVQKYYDELHKKHKSVKEEESGTSDVVQSIQTISTSLNKAKEMYHTRYLEYEKLRRENSSSKDTEKAEIKYKKAFEDYKNYLEKYSVVRDDFEQKMKLSCQHYQTIEEEHLNQMKTFLLTFSEVIETGHSKIGEINVDFRQKCDEMTIDKLLDQFVSLKTTGVNKPGLIEFEEADLSSLSQLSTPDQLHVNNEKSHIKKEGFLKSRRDRKKEKKKKKKSESKSEDDQRNDSQAGTPVVDEEGYSVRPPEANVSPQYDKDFYTSSEEDSDDEKEKKIRVEIKPIANGSAPMSASVDELRAQVGTLSLSPPVNSNSKKGSSMSVDIESSMNRNFSSQQFKPSNDLMGLNLFSPPASMTSTPTGLPDNRSKSPAFSIETPTQNSEISALFEASQNSTKSNPTQSNGSVTLRSATPTSAIPRPSSRKGLDTSSRGRMSPSISQMSRTDSVGSLGNISADFKATSMPVGSSRGPSPLTIGMSDSIPLAVAFQEVVHAFFKGTEESKCQVKLVGDMMLSFPAGIVQVLANNPSPAVLSFKLKNISKMTNIIANKQLISSEINNQDNNVYEFNMTALTNLLKRQSEQAPSASYYNVDILKYHVKVMPGARSTPLQLVSYWKCESNTTDLRIDYKYNPVPLNVMKPLSYLSITVPIDGGVKNMQSKPSGSWMPESNRVVWKIQELSTESEGGGLGSLRARFDLNDGPSTPSTVAVQFACEGTSLSGVDFELAGLGYRLSLLKKRCVAGKYICEKESAV